MKTKNRTTVVINRNGMGESPAALGHTLIKNYLTLLIEEEELPSYLCFYGEGVKLTLKGSPVIEELHRLEEAGVNILICKTCLMYFDALQKVAAGSVGTMLDIMGAQKNCDKVIVL